MTAIAPTLQRFFADRLTNQRQASPATVSAYRDTFRLLLKFIQDTEKISPHTLDFTDLDASRIAAFLTYLENDRDNSIRTRNARLAAIHAFFKYATLQHPEHAELIARVLSIPQKRFDKAIVEFLTTDEVEAILAAPDLTTWIGARDHALLTLAIQTGLRVSEITGLTLQDLTLTAPAAHVRCHGKGRKHRSTPLTTGTVTSLRQWLQRHTGPPTAPLFPSRHGTALSADTVQWLVNKYATLATQQCPTLTKKHVTPHVLRHTAAMFLREAGVDISVIALWLGHESIVTTQMYLHADLALKQQAMDKTTPIDARPNRYQTPDTLLEFLEGL